MSIRIRVYPQPHSIGARRNRAIRRQQQMIRQSFNWQQQLLRQQMQQRMYGYGGMGGYGFSASPWSSPINTAWSGAYSMPGYGYSSGFSSPFGYSTGFASGYGGYGYSPVGVAQYAGYGIGRGWNC
jgi:hypothetical protein